MLTLPAQIARISTLADGSWRLYIDLGELSPEKVAELSKTVNQAVIMALTLGNDFSDEEKEVLSELQKEKVEIKEENHGQKEEKRTWG